MQKFVAMAMATAVLALAACAPPSPPVRVATSPYADGVQHTEPVFYNGRNYEVSFRFDAAGNHYDVTVAGKGRKLGSTPGDQQIVEQIAASAVRHFACPTGQRGHIVPGSVRHGGAAWDMQARCA